MESLLDDTALRVDRYRNLLLVRDRLPGFVRPANPRAWQELARVEPLAADMAAQFPGASAALNVLPAGVRDGIAALSTLTLMLANKLPVCHLLPTRDIRGLAVRAYGRFLTLDRDVVFQRNRSRVAPTLSRATTFLVPLISTPATPWEQSELEGVVTQFIRSVEA